MNKNLIFNLSKWEYDKNEIIKGGMSEQQAEQLRNFFKYE